MPLPRRAAPFGADMRLFAQRTFGQLANVFMLDTRHHRSPLACTQPGRRGARSASCSELHDPTRSKLGAAQEGWLYARMAAGRTRWNLFASGTVMAYVDEQPGDGELFWTDGWNGYPAARERFMEAIANTKIANPVVLSGDVHAFVVANHHRTPRAVDSPIIASEFVTTSISSQGVPEQALHDRRAINPNLLFATSTHRGYLRLDLTPQRLQADLVAVRDATDRASDRFVQASFVIEDGRPVATSGA